MKNIRITKILVFQYTRVVFLLSLQKYPKKKTKSSKIVSFVVSFCSNCMNPARQNILNRIKKALQTACPSPFSETETGTVFSAIAPSEYLAHFRLQFEAVGGFFVQVSDQKLAAYKLKELFDTEKWTALACWESELQNWLQTHQIPYRDQTVSLLDTQVGISSCRALLARTGTIVVQADQNKGRGISVVPPIHVVLATKSQLLPDLSDYFETTNFAHTSMTCLITGASRTADIEKTLVMGAHGPKEIYLIYIDEQEKL